VRGRCLVVGDISERDLAAWQDLATRAVEPNPLFEPACIVPAARYLAGGDDIRLVVAEEAGRFYACLPVKAHDNWHRLPITTLTTNVRRMTYLGTPLVDAARGVEAARTLLDALGQWTEVGKEAGLLELKWVHAGGAVDQFFRLAVVELGLACYTTESFERPLVERRPDRDYGAHFSSKYRGVLNRRRRQLGRDLGGEVGVENRADRLEVIGRLIDMEAAGYKGRTGVSLTSVPGETEQFQKMAQTFAEQGRLQLLTLEARGRAAAMQLSVRGGEGLFAIKVSYDESLAKHGPGVLLQLGSIDYFHDCTDAAWIDSCTYPGNDTLSRLYPDRRSIATYLVSLGGRREAALVRALPAMRELRTRTQVAWAQGILLASRSRSTISRMRTAKRAGA